MVNEDKASLYLLAIVGIVAAVGIVVLLLNAGGLTGDLSGQATAKGFKADCPSGKEFDSTKGACVSIYAEKVGIASTKTSKGSTDWICCRNNNEGFCTCFCENSCNACKGCP